MIEFPLLCRLCGSKTDNGLYIYCDEGKRRQVETKIRLYLHFQVLPSDSLPKKICATCFEELEGMHRFAINALKVQDQLSRLAKESPLTAIDVCKTFMNNYVPDQVMVNETVASLTNQEVTEMEVQVDPMVFLEDDQIDYETQDSNNETNSGTTEDIGSQLPHGSDEENVASDKENGSPPHRSVALPNQVKIKSEEHEKLVEVLPVHSSENGEDSAKHETKAEQGKIPEASAIQPVQQSPSGEKVDIKANGQGGSLIEPSKKEEASLSKDTSHSSLKKGKKGCSVNKNMKKIDLKSASTENIKCITYTCPICKKVLMKKGLFKAHLETHRTDHKYACEICLRVFKKEINLLRHQKSHSELTTFPCTHCNRVYPTKSTLRSHLVSHSDERPHVCSICSKSFKRNQDLKFHLNQHNGLRPYQCPYCTKAFASSGNCFSHRRRAHMQEIERDRALRKSAATTS